ncbi:tRNA (guanosine(37)-N1)-methyltransferase TrmD [Elusimicrobium posterum]|uniref:tRNA (guanosine(37)-N1)-methyltransferase TrmD n=1 Tax=Elusimicrobium posterum TaxID=3116653 RepID=UPI003C735D47
MKIDVVTAFEEIVDAPLKQSIVGRARKEGILELGFLNPRDFTTDKHKTIDDRPYGGGTGMILKAEPLYQAVKKLKKRGSYVIYTSPRGKVFNQEMAKELAKKKHLIFVCGHYEGVDARIYPEFDLEVSLGDFIITGGEIAAAVMIDAVTRLLKGTFKKDGVTEAESFENNLLEAPQYTRPEVWRGEKVPEVLLSGNHKAIEIWKQNEAVKITKKFRPDLLKPLSSKKGKKKSFSEET